jgi:hypothetical protein
MTLNKKWIILVIHVGVMELEDREVVHTHALVIHSFRALFFDKSPQYVNIMKKSTTIQRDRSIHPLTTLLTIRAYPATASAGDECVKSGGPR